MTHPHRCERTTGRGLAARQMIGWGVGAAALYVMTVVMSVPWSPGSGRILYDGLAPLVPYRWTHPPQELARDNQPPEPGETTLPLVGGSPPGSVTTGDGQASVIFEENTVAPVSGESAVRVSLAPLDPATVAAAPAGTRFDGNAYKIDARYASSGQPVRLRAPATVILRYATGATQIVRATDAGWTAVQAVIYPGNLQLVVAKSEVPGIFAPVAPKNLPYTTGPRWWIYIVAGVPVIIVLLIGYVPRILARRRASGVGRRR